MKILRKMLSGFLGLVCGFVRRKSNAKDNIQSAAASELAAVACWLLDGLLD